MAGLGREAVIPRLSAISNRWLSPDIQMRTFQNKYNVKIAEREPRQLKNEK